MRLRRQVAIAITTAWVSSASFLRLSAHVCVPIPCCDSEALVHLEEFLSSIFLQDERRVCLRNFVACFLTIYLSI